MDEGARRSPLIAGVVAVVVGGALLAVSLTDGPARPRVLGETVAAATTTTSAPPVPPPTSSTVPASSRPRTTVRAAAPSPPIRPVPSTTTSTSTSDATSTSTPGTTSPSPPTTAPCPAGEPVAALRTFEAASDEDGVWHAEVTGIVTNGTGATVEVDAVAIVFTRADGSTYEVPAEERPLPDPRTIAHGAEATWRFEGAVPPGAEITDVVVTLTGWRWADIAATPASCHR